MRGIRQLAAAPDEPTKPRRTTVWNPTKGALFGAGVLLLVSGLATTAYNYRHYSAFAEVAAYRPSEEDLAYQIELMQQSPPEQLWVLWHEEVLKKGLGDHEQSPFVIARTQAAYYRGTLALSTAVAIAGLISLLASFALRGSPARPANQ
jgi:hypothetical protein